MHFYTNISPLLLFIRDHQAGKETSVNSIASIYAWTRGLGQRAKLDNNPELTKFCLALEKACIDTVEAGHLTRDLVECVVGPENVKDDMWLNTVDSLCAISEQFKRQWSK